MMLPIQKTIRSKPLYPLGFALLPVVFLAAQNARMITATDPMRASIFTLTFSLVLFILLRWIVRDWQRAALIDTAILAFLFAFGHLVNQIEKGLGRGLTFWEQSLAALVYCLVFLTGLFFLLRIRRLEMITRVLNVLVIGALGLNVLQWLVVTVSTEIPLQNEAVQFAEQRGDGPAGADAASAGATPPNIYFIILDSYQGSPALQKYDRFDNSAFILGLRERGFFVAEQSRSNYLTTVYSLPATLNLMYIHDQKTKIFNRLTSSLQVNFVHDFLHNLGYHTVRFESGFAATDNAPADEVVSPMHEVDRNNLSAFEVLLLKTTLARLVVDGYSEPWVEGGATLNRALNYDFDLRRERIMNAFTHLSDFARTDGPQYVFAHIVAPHNPYLWDEQGKERVFVGKNELVGDRQDPQRDSELYIAQLQYVNTRVLETIDQILARSKTPPIIILQGDHGHDTYLEWTAQDANGIDQRSSILNAMYLPGMDTTQISDAISPVNTFRIVFNHYFGTRYPLLPDRVYAHPKPGQGMLFTDACEKYNLCPEGGRQPSMLK